MQYELTTRLENARLEGVLAMTVEGRQMTSRIPVTPETHRRIQGFAQGLGVTFDEALNFLLDELIEDEPSWPAGDNRRSKLEARRKKKEAGGKKSKE